MKKIDIEKLREEKIILFGASRYGEEVVEFLQENNVDIMGFVDNDSKKWGNLLKGYLVMSPDALNSKIFDTIIITSLYASEIYNQLRKMNVDTKKMKIIPLARIKEYEPSKNICREPSIIKKNIKEYKKNKINLNFDIEAIRISIIFQIASFWPSLESLYEEMMADDRFDVKVFLYGQSIVETKQTESAKKFLIDKKIEYTDYKEESLDKYKPHIIILQSPYDVTHRPEQLSSGYLTSKGYRVVYVPYGIEISDTKESQDTHFNNFVVLNAWRVYTFSEKIINDYRRYSLIDNCNVRSLGHPKFDKIYNYEKCDIYNEIKLKAQGRKIILWKIHFPKVIYIDGEHKMGTPYLEEYYKFAKNIEKYKDLFFVVMMHPKFLEMCSSVTDGVFGFELVERIGQYNNTFNYVYDDYIPGLMCSDFIMIDRSSLMVEAAATGKPILYLTNEEYYEPVTEAIRELIDSYYHGTRYDDMLEFIDMCTRAEDPKQVERKLAFEKCVPNFDGESGIRIKEDIVEGTMSGQD